ncbi:MAG: hypothetical protein V2I43_02550 [Parvularcula sp.]|nr:hypothetical protein [Parvularcula sp.]
MSFGNIIGNMLNKGMSSQSHDSMRMGVQNAESGGGIEQMLGSLLGGLGLRAEAGAAISPR